MESTVVQPSAAQTRPRGCTSPVEASVPTIRPRTTSSISIIAIGRSSLQIVRISVEDVLAGTQIPTSGDLETRSAGGIQGFRRSCWWA
jgi:hypothetical protein